MRSHTMPVGSIIFDRLGEFCGPIGVACAEIDNTRVQNCESAMRAYASAGLSHRIANF
jgi:hypothetical protein